jgi:rhamnulokinase
MSAGASTGAGGQAFAAVDLGASSGRVMLGRVGPDSLELTEANRFRNGPIRLPDGFYWDILGLYQDILAGLRKAAREAGDLAGVGIDSWGVDYGLLDANGALRGNPHSYRDPRSEATIEKVHQQIDPARLYAVNGLQVISINTIYQLAAEPDLQHAHRCLMTPDLLGYWLTGREAAEETIASTTGLVDARTGRWAPELVEALGLPTGLLPEIVAAGEVLASVSSDVRDELGIDGELLVTTVGSHDTASAIVGVPATGRNFGYVSCGTWALVGVELDAPVLTDDSRQANFTNERGIDGTIRYLRNVMGLWLLSESLRWWNRRGDAVGLQDVLSAAADLPPGPQVDPTNPAFLAPGDMPSRIVEACREAGDRVPENPPEVVRCILDSLATAFADSIDQAERLSGQPVEVVHIVGGGSQNTLLCQLTADACRRPVVAGPVEATALGNLLVQARTHGAVTGDLRALRERVRQAATLTTYEPRRA